MITTCPGFHWGAKICWSEMRKTVPSMPPSTVIVAPTPSLLMTPRNVSVRPRFRGLVAYPLYPSHVLHLSERCNQKPF